MFDGITSDDVRGRARSSTSSHHSVFALLFTPTVGSLVLLCPKQCELSFVWEDMGPEAKYIKCAIHHMLVGKIVRETDTQFVVLFDIPDSYVSAMQCVCGTPSPQDGNKESEEIMNEDRTKQTAIDEYEEDFAFIRSRRPTMDSSFYDEATPQLRLSTRSVQQNQRTSIVTAPSISALDETAGAAIKLGACVSIIELPFVFDVVPVLPVSGENAPALSPHGCEKVKQKLDEACNTKCKQEWPAGRSDVPAPQHIPFGGPSPSQSHIATVNDCSHTTKSFGFVHVSFSIKKVCCSSLLHKILEKHNKVLDVTSAVRLRDFALAKQIVLSVIRTYTEVSGMDLNSLFLHSQSLVQNDDRHDFSQGSIDWRAALASTLHLARVQNSMTESPLLPSLPIGDSQRKTYTNQHLGILYALLSYIRFNDKECQESLRDAIKSLTLDTTCLEAYMRVIISCMALGCVQEAFMTASIALRCCTAVNQQFVQLSRSVHVYYYYSRLKLSNCGMGDRIDVIPYTQHNRRISEMESFLDKSQPGNSTPMSTVRTICPYFLRMRQLSQSIASAQMYPLHCTLPGSSQMMDYFLRSVRARATGAMEMGEVVFDENVSLLIVLPFKHIIHESIKKSENKTETRFQKAEYKSCCSYCGYSIVCKNDILAEVNLCESSILCEYILNTFTPREPVPCAGGCGEKYCSEICRSRATVEYHSMECDLPWNCEKEDCADFLNMAPEGVLSFSVNLTDSKASQSESVTFEDVSLGRPGIRQLVDLHRARHKCAVSIGLSHSSRLNAVYEIRSAIKSFYSSINGNSQPCFSRAVTTALLVAGRISTSVLSLFLPVASPESIKNILSRYVSRGFEPLDGHDPHALYLAEEILQQIGLPFFADTNNFKPLTVWEVLRESPYQKKKKENGSCAADDTAHASSPDAIYGFESLWRLLDQVHTIIQTYLQDEPVAFSASVVSDINDTSCDMRMDTSVDLWSKNLSASNSYTGSSTSPLYTVKVWVAFEENDFSEHHGNSNRQKIHAWTCGHMLRFLGVYRFAEQLWDFCLSSYAVMTNFNLFATNKIETLSSEENNEWNNLCRRYAVDLAVMGPLTSIASDVTAFSGNAAYSRFVTDLLTETKQNPLDIRRNDSRAMSVLSINSHEQEDLRQSVSFVCSERKSSSSMTQRGSLWQATNTMTANLEGSISLEKPGMRRVIMKARQNIAPGEELRFGTDHNQV